MRYRTLGSSDLNVSEISLGSWLTYSGGVEADATRACTEAAFDAGINFFDTANAYGRGAAETAWGEILSGHPRDSYILATKVYFPMSDDPADRGLSPAHIAQQIDASLTRLRTDHVDLYQAHRFDHETPLEETFQAFADVVRQGKALYIGVSEWTAEQLREGHALARSYGVQLISNQPQYSALWRVIEGKVVPASEELGISQIVWSPMAQGVLSGKYLPGQPVPEGSRATDEKSGAGFIKSFLRDEVLQAVQGLKPVAEQAGLSMPQLAIAWVLQNKNVASALVGASRPEQLAETVKASGVVLDADTLAAIDAALGDVVYRDPEDTYTVSPETRLV